MVTPKKYKKTLTSWLLLLFFAVYPFGQLIRFSTLVEKTNIALIGLDVVLLFTFLSYIFLNGVKQTYYEMKSYLWVVIVFSNALFASYLTLGEIAIGLLYLLRIVIYVGLFYIVKSQIGQGVSKKMVRILLMASSIIIAIFGLVQYSIFPDLIGAVSYGWDAHLYRLVGTFFDPGFVGIILVLGFIISFLELNRHFKPLFYLSTIVFIVPILLTYSRATYLAFVISLLTLMFFVKPNLRVVLLSITLMFILALPFLPRPRGVGVQLERTHSVITRITNYEVTYQLWRSYPIFGVGYNNICAAKRINGHEETAKHACSGSDSSLLFLLTTIGVVGIASLIHEFLRFNSVEEIFMDGLLFTSMVAVLVHSLFLNSLFYPWVFTWLVIIFALHKQNKSESIDSIVVD